MENVKDTLKALLKDSDFKQEYDALEPEYQIIREILRCREEKNLTQVELSNLTGISQADISRLENGEANPTISILNRIAVAFGKQLKVSMV